METKFSILAKTKSKIIYIFILVQGDVEVASAIKVTNYFKNLI